MCSFLSIGYLITSQGSRMSTDPSTHPITPRSSLSYKMNYRHIRLSLMYTTKYIFLYLKLKTQTEALYIWYARKASWRFFHLWYLVRRKCSEDREQQESGSRAGEPNVENRKNSYTRFAQSGLRAPTAFRLRLAHLCCDSLFVRTHHLTSSLWPA